MSAGPATLVPVSDEPWTKAAMPPATDSLAKAKAALGEFALASTDYVRAGLRKEVGQTGFAPLAKFLAQHSRYTGLLLFPLVGHILLALLFGSGAVGVVLASYFFFLSLLILNQAASEMSTGEKNPDGMSEAGS